MTFAEIKDAVQNNLASLKAIMDTLEHKVKEAEEIIELARAELSKYKSIFYSTWELTINRKGKNYGIRIYWGDCIDELMIYVSNEYKLTPHNTLLLADMMPNITAFIAKEMNNTLQAFPAPDDTISTRPIDEDKKEEPKKSLSGWQVLWRKRK